MDRIIDSLSSHSRIGLDTSVFIYHFEEHGNYIPFTTTILDGIQSGKWNGVTSVITLMEINVLPLRLERNTVAQTYETLLVNFPNLQIVDVNRDIARKAAQLRASYNLKPADALHIATSIIGGVTAWISNDKTHMRVSDIFSTFIFEEFGND